MIDLCTLSFPFYWLNQNLYFRYAEAGLYQAGNISSSSGASSGSHPASPLPHSLFTHEPLYQFYNAAKVEVLSCTILILYFLNKKNNL